MKIKKEMHHIHDKSYKDLFSNKELLIEMIQSFVESSWSKEITKDNIELVNKSYILSDYEELESDIVYKATIDNREVIFLGQRIEDILISKKEEAESMTSNISKTIKETFEQTREEGREEGIEEGIETEREKSRIKDVDRVLKLLTKKFKDIDNVLKKKIEKLDADKLNLIIENILDIESLKEVQKYL